jgi:hypothetical protein
VVLLSAKSIDLKAESLARRVWFVVLCRYDQEATGWLGEEGKLIDQEQKI